MKPPLLQATRLSRRYPETPGFALQVEELALAAGGLTVLHGANGAGKSTLLRILAGLDCGGRQAEFNWRGDRIERPQPGRHTAFLSQDPYLFKTSARQNVIYPLARLGLPIQDAELSLQWAGLADCADRSVRTLSGGQRRRLALARIHAMPAPLVILDEPSAQLDADATDALGRLVRQLAAEGRSVLISTHDTRMENLLSETRTIGMTDGKLSSERKR